MEIVKEQTQSIVALKLLKAMELFLVCRRRHFECIFEYPRLVDWLAVFLMFQEAVDPYDF